MNKYLLFRTDRIGDFLLSAILIKSIKRNDKYSHITLIASKKNYKYICTLKFIDKVILYPDNFFKRIFFFIKIFKSNFKLKIALDGKKRSIYGCLLGRSNYKFLLTTKKFYKKIFRFFFTKVIYKDDFSSKILEIKFILNEIGYDLKLIDYNIFVNEKNFPVQKNQSGTIMLHFDEKWIFNDYIKKYTNIEPTYDQFYKFICEMTERTDNDLHITTGFIDNIILKKLRLIMNFNEKFYWKDYKSHKIYLHYNSSFLDLKKIIYNSSKIICCHGAPTHVAAAMDKEIIDIYDENEELFYQKWNSHFRKYNFLYRTNFKDLSKKILNLL